MATKEEMKNRIEQIAVEIGELHAERNEESNLIMGKIGTDELKGINLDELTAFARRVRKLNTQMKDLADERRAIRAERLAQALEKCECDCHQS